MRCDKIMKRDVLSLRPSDTVQWAALTMRDNDVGFLPVVDEGGKALGALTDRDIAVRLCAESLPCTTRVEAIYTRECVSVRPEDDIRSAEELMAQHRKSRIMVIDELGRLRGVISLSDIAEAHPGDAAAETLRGVARREARPRARPHEAPWKSERAR